jgi:DHA1 family multidrug resistance protein B-like MFS transporter
MVLPLTTVFLARQVGPATAGLLLFVSVLLSALAGLAAGYLAERYGRRRALLASAGLMTAGFAVMAAGAASGAVALVYAGFLIEAIAGTFIRPVHDAVMLDVTRPEERRFVYAFNYWSVNLALGGGALIGTFLYAGHFTALLAGAAAIMVAATVLTFAYFAETAGPRARDDLRDWRGMLARSYLTPLRDRSFLRRAGDDRDPRPGDAARQRVHRRAHSGSAPPDADIGRARARVRHRSRIARCRSGHEHRRDRDRGHVRGTGAPHHA